MCIQGVPIYGFIIIQQLLPFFSGEAFSGESSGIDSGANETNLESFNSAVDCISGHQLREIVFSGFLKRVDAHLSLLSDLYLSSESHLAALKWLVGASDILWRLFRESTPSSQEKLSCCVGNDLNFITLTLRVLCATLQLSGKLQSNYFYCHIMLEDLAHTGIGV